MSGKWFLGTNKYHYTNDLNKSVCEDFTVRVGRAFYDEPPIGSVLCAVCAGKLNRAKTAASPPQVCPSCKGSGTYTGLFETSPCDECKGAGQVVASAPAAPVTARETQASALLASPEAIKDVANWLIEEVDEAARKTMLETGKRVAGDILMSQELYEEYKNGDWNKEYEAKYGDSYRLSSPIVAAPNPDISYSGHILQGWVLPCGEQLLELGQRGRPYRRFLSFPSSEVEFSCNKHLEQCMRATAMRREAMVKAALESGITNPVIQVDVSTGEEKVIDGLPRMDDPRIKSLTCTPEEHIVLEVHKSLAVSQGVEIDV